MEKINEQIIKKLIDLQLTVATCESMTRGLLANKFVEVEYAFKVFLGGFVSYSKKKAKSILLVLTKKLLINTVRLVKNVPMKWREKQK